MQNHIGTTTPKAHIKRALDIEALVPESEKELYLECINNKQMDKRHTEQELRDGCILINHVYLDCSTKHPYVLKEERL